MPSCPASLALSATRSAPEQAPRQGACPYAKLQPLTESHQWTRAWQPAASAMQHAQALSTSRPACMQLLSHVVLQMVTSTGKLTLVDLAGSERASETNNRGRQLRDGANINRHAALVLCGHC